MKLPPVIIHLSGIFSINHPFWGSPIYGNPHINVYICVCTQTCPAKATFFPYISSSLGELQRVSQMKGVLRNKQHRQTSSQILISLGRLRSWRAKIIQIHFVVQSLHHPWQVFHNTWWMFVCLPHSRSKRFWMILDYLQFVSTICLSREASTRFHWRRNARPHAQINTVMFNHQHVWLVLFINGVFRCNLDNGCIYIYLYARMYVMYVCMYVCMYVM